MRFDTSQHMRMSQQMKLAPRMIQSMEILQMPLMALQERIDQELESNIALEQIEPGRNNEDGVETIDRDTDLAQRELVVGERDDSSASDFERLDSMESSYRDAFDNEYSSSSYSRARMDGERDRKMDAMNNVAARQDSLVDQLLHQWHLMDLPQDIAAAGEKIIGYIDDDGLLSADLDTILEQSSNIPGLAMNMELLEKSLKEIQQRLDPPGVGARNRQECLLLQIDRFAGEGESDDDISLWQDLRTLVEKHYDDLLENRLPAIAQATDLSVQRIGEALKQMRKLSVSPGRNLVDEDVPPIIPDVIVEYDEQADEYIGYLSDGFLPALRVSKRYEKMAKDKAVEKPTREFVSENVSRAQWLIDSINQRKHTLMRVVNVVLAHQRDYFDRGPQFLKPLPMIDVADQLGIHVATVSRAVAEKWMQTPRGLVALRKFFSGGTETESGRDMSWDAVKATLKEVVENENKADPLSDEAIAAALKEKGIDIARRTVVKYRQQLDIPPARRRKVYSG